MARPTQTLNVILIPEVPALGNRLDMIRFQSPRFPALAAPEFIPLEDPAAGLLPLNRAVRPGFSHDGYPSELRENPLDAIYEA